MFASSSNVGKNRKDIVDHDGGEREREDTEDGVGGGDGGGEGGGGRGQSTLHTHQDAGPFLTFGHQNLS
jgi:hypothetical protein